MTIKMSKNSARKTKSLILSDLRWMRYIKCIVNRPRLSDCKSIKFSFNQWCLLHSIWFIWMFIVSIRQLDYSAKCEMVHSFMAIRCERAKNECLIEKQIVSFIFQVFKCLIGVLSRNSDNITRSSSCGSPPPVEQQSDKRNDTLINQLLDVKKFAEQKKNATNESIRFVWGAVTRWNTLLLQNGMEERSQLSGAKACNTTVYIVHCFAGPANWCATLFEVSVSWTG